MPAADFANLTLINSEDLVREEAKRQGVDPNLAAAVARQESGGQQKAVSPKGATGVMQLMPTTASGLGVNPNIQADNIRGGVTYLKDMIKRYGGDRAKALAAYNAGPGRVDSGKPLPDETKQYVAAITPQTSKTPVAVDFSDLDLGGTPPPPSPTDDLTSAQPIGPLAKSGRPGFLTRSLVETITGKSAATEYDKLLPALQSVLPESMRGKYATELAAEVSKAGPQIADFITSPAGIALTAAHLFPASAPLAAAADMYLGLRQGITAIPDTMDALAHLDDPHKVGRAIVDIAGAYAGLKGGAKIGGALRDVPTDVAAGRPLVGAIADRIRQTSQPPTGPAGPGLRARLDAAIPADIPSIIEEAAQPTNLRAKAEQTLYRTPIVRGLVNVLGPRVKQPPILELGQELVDERAGAIASEQNRVRRVTDWIRRNVPEEDQNIRRLGYAMEGDLPESELSPQGREALGMLRQLNRDRDAMLTEAYGDSVNLKDPDAYIRHYWDFDDGTNPALKFGAASRMMRDRSLQARKIGSLKYGIEEEGLTPKYENVTDVVRRRHMEAVQSVENQKFANTLRDYGLIIDPTKANVRSHTGWAEASDAPALKRAVYSGEGKSGETILRDKPPLVHPDIEMAINAIFNEPFKGVTWNVLNQLRAFSKQIAVGFSLFHNNALSEVAQAEAAGAGSLKAIPRFIRAVAWPADPEFIKGVRNAIWEVRGKVAPEAPPDVSLSREAIDPWLKANLSFQSSESEAVAIQNAREFLAKRGPLLRALGSPVRALGNVQHVFNRALFDYYLPGQMLHSAEHLYATELNRVGPDAPPAVSESLRRDIADHINRAYGADNMQRLLLTPKAQQALGLAFFAPMWTLSNLRVLAKGFETTTGAALTSRYVAGAALTYFLTSQLANYAVSDWYAKHQPTGGEYWDDETKQWKRGGHCTWQNPGDPVKMGGRYVPGVTDNVANIYFGQNPDGSQRYIRLGKAFREPFMWFMHPLETWGNKASMPVRQAWVQLSGVEPGSGYPVINTKLTPEQQKEQRVGEMAEMATPFVARDLLQRLERYVDPKIFRESGATSQLYGLPARKGASFYKSVEDLRDALEDGRQDMVQQVLRNASLNKISPQGVIRELRSRLRSETRTEVGKPKTETPPTVMAPPVDFGNLEIQR